MDSAFQSNVYLVAALCKQNENKQLTYFGEIEWLAAYITCLYGFCVLNCWWPYDVCKRLEFIFWYTTRGKIEEKRRRRGRDAILTGEYERGGRERERQWEEEKNDGRQVQQMAISPWTCGFSTSRTHELHKHAYMWQHSWNINNLYWSRLSFTGRMWHTCFRIHKHAPHGTPSKAMELNKRRKCLHVDDF